VSPSNHSGRDTTATALSWTFYRLFEKHRDVLAQCRKDAEAAVSTGGGVGGGDAVDYEAASKMK